MTDPMWKPRYAYADESGDAQSLNSNVRWACRVAGRPEQGPADIRLLDSGHSLIQCADMVTGAAAEFANHGDVRWLNSLRTQLTVYWDERFDHDQQKNSSN